MKWDEPPSRYRYIVYIYIYNYIYIYACMCLYMQIILTNKMWDAHPMRMYPSGKQT